MQKCFIGNSDIAVSRVGLGTVKLGRNTGVKYPASFALPTDKEMADLLAVAEELGINLLDTAPAYGSSEERLGHWLRNHDRKRWIICTKVGEEFIQGEPHYYFSSPDVIKSIERSLKRLHTDYLDIVLVHSNGDDQRIIEQENIFTTLESLKQAGKIRLYGMSTKTRAGGLLTIGSADLAMVTLNPTDTNDRGVIAYAYQKQKGIFIKKALASGHMCYSIEENMQFIFSEPGVTSVIMGTLNPLHLQENVNAVEKVLLGR